MSLCRSRNAEDRAECARRATFEVADPDGPQRYRAVIEALEDGIKRVYASRVDGKRQCWSRRSFVGGSAASRRGRLPSARTAGVLEETRREGLDVPEED